jgi:phosphotransferase system enzyme I (PtsI)
VKKTIEIKGIPAAPGVTYGAARVVYSWEQTIEERAITKNQVDKEVNRLETAVKKSQQELEKLKESAGKKIGGPVAGIFESQILIATDPEFLKNVKNRIASDLKSAEYIYSMLAEESISHLKASKDQYLRQMVVDIEAVSSRVVRHLTGQTVRHISQSAQDSIFVGQLFTAAEVLTLYERKVRAIVTTGGGANSHMALIARSLLIPTVVGVDHAHVKIKTGDRLIVDGTEGIVKVNPSQTEWNELRKKKAKVTARQVLKLDRLPFFPPKTLDDVEINLSANIDLPGPVDRILAEHRVGIGLFRTEFIYLQNGRFPSEDRQFEIYDQIAKRYYPQAVVIRTFDLGSDKYYSSAKMVKENNPALGWRGIRAAFDMPGVFKNQVRAILKASSRGNVKILLPMISDLSELRRALRLINRSKKELEKANIKIDENIHIGIMIEVPSAAVSADILGERVDFFSIGSNDLTQYTLAADRTNQKLVKIFNPLHPAVLRMIQLAVEAGRKHNIPVTVCGEMAGDIIAVPLLLGMGVNQLSMNPSKLYNVCRLIPRIKMSRTVDIARKTLRLKTLKEVETALFDYNIKL